MIRHHQVKPYHRKLQTLKHVENIKFQKNLHMTHHWKGFDLEITDFD